MAIDLQKLEQKFDALINDPNFVTDFEQWLEARNVSQNSGNAVLWAGGSGSEDEWCGKCRHYRATVRDGGCSALGYGSCMKQVISVDADDWCKLFAAACP